ncbi:hypothetical protein GF386_05195 [Candidatus Pacearchaeota archaeon]|nr:hypothetical protein [Candidatus Pacearchaeota archaeon]MBD3283505.1 hypothetical protein [Candidatus Pacearchaeota archaeon]
MATGLDDERTRMSGNGFNGDSLGYNKTRTISLYRKPRELKDMLEVRVDGEGVQSREVDVGVESETRFLEESNGDKYAYALRRGDSGYEVALVHGRVVKDSHAYVLVENVEEGDQERVRNLFVRELGEYPVCFEE